MTIQRHRGFTLIELLVAIATISVLLAMLLPSIKEAIEMGRMAVCMSNLRQIYLALPVYAMDYTDYIPTPDNGSVGSNADWHIKLGQTGVWGQAQSYSGLGHSSGADSQQLGWPILKCPSETGAVRADNEPYYRWANGRTSYAMNFFMLHGKPSPDGWQYRVARKGWERGPLMPQSRGGYPTVFSPSAAGIIMDIPGTSNRWTAAHYNYVLDWITDPHLSWAMYAFRHNQRANKLYWDGHVESQRHFIETGKLVFDFIFADDWYPYTGNDAPATAWADF